jgi:hypothetical protein
MQAQATTLPELSTISGRKAGNGVWSVTPNRESLVGRSTTPRPPFRIKFTSCSSYVGKGLSSPNDCRIYSSRHWHRNGLLSGCGANRFEGARASSGPLASERHRLAAHDHCAASIQRTKGSNGSCCLLFCSRSCGSTGDTTTQAMALSRRKPGPPGWTRRPLVRAAFLLTDRTQFPAPRSFPAHPDLKHTSNPSTVLFLVFRVF